MSQDDVIVLKRENGILRQALIALAPLAFDVLSVDKYHALHGLIGLQCGRSDWGY